MAKKVHYILFFSIFLCLFKFSFSEKKIVIIEGDNLDLAINNSRDSNFKLFLIFYVKNCPYCTRALKVLKDQVIKNFDEQEDIFFGSVDLDNQLNVWVGLRFNITKIPYIILIENNKMYHYESQFEESLVLKFINEEKNLEDGQGIPNPVTFMKKFEVAVQELTERMQSILNKFGIKINWNNYMTYILLISFLAFFVYVENKIIKGCQKLCSFKKNNKNNNINKVIKEKDKHKKLVQEHEVKKTKKE